MDLFKSYNTQIVHYSKKSLFIFTDSPLCEFAWNRSLNISFNKANGLMYIIYLLFSYVAFNSQGHIAKGSLQVEETSAYCTVNHRASASNYQLSNMKRPGRDSNRRPQRLEERTLTATPPSPLLMYIKLVSKYHLTIVLSGSSIES